MELSYHIKEIILCFVIACLSIGVENVFLVKRVACLVRGYFSLLKLYFKYLECHCKVLYHLSQSVINGQYPSVL